MTHFRDRSSSLIRLAAFALLGFATATSAAGEIGHQELRIAWTVHDAIGPVERGTLAPEARIDHLTVLDRRRVAHVARQRRPQVGADHIVVVAVDGAGTEKGRSIVTDPRLLRTEVPDEAGNLSSRSDVVRPVAHFLVTLPDDPAIRTLRILEPHWETGALELVPVAELPLPAEELP